MAAGRNTVTQNDVENEGRFDDIVAYAGWSMDDHFPEGFYYSKGHPTIYHPAPSPWGLPLRSMISKNIKNLTFAGRNISVTHAALSSSRVMATCGALGQALGTAVSLALKQKNDIRKVDIQRLQAELMEDDCHIPWQERKVSELSENAVCTSDIVRNGKDRGEENCFSGELGDSLIYEFENETYISEIRLVFDSDLNRKYYNMPCRYPLKEHKYCVPRTLVKTYDIVVTSADGEVDVLHLRTVISAL